MSNRLTGDQVAVIVRAFLTVGSERTAVDSARKLLRNADGSPLTRAEAVALVRSVRPITVDVIDGREAET